MKVLNTKEFDEAIASGKVVIDFYADWCGPCRMLTPVLEDIGEERSDYKIYKVNTDNDPELAMRYGVQAIPNLVVFVDGKPVDQIVGYMDFEDLNDRLK